MEGNKSFKKNNSIIKKPKNINDLSDKSEDLVNWIDNLKSRLNNELKYQNDEIIKFNKSLDVDELRQKYSQKVFIEDLPEPELAGEVSDQSSESPLEESDSEIEILSEHIDEESEGEEIVDAEDWNSEQNEDQMEVDPEEHLVYSRKSVGGKYPRKGISEVQYSQQDENEHSEVHNYDTTEYFEPEEQIDNDNIHTEHLQTEHIENDYKLGHGIDDLLDPELHENIADLVQENYDKMDFEGLDDLPNDLMNLAEAAMKEADEERLQDMEIDDTQAPQALADKITELTEGYNASVEAEDLEPVVREESPVAPIPQPFELEEIEVEIQSEAAMSEGSLADYEDNIVPIPEPDVMPIVDNVSVEDGQEEDILSGSDIEVPTSFKTVDEKTSEEVLAELKQMEEKFGFKLSVRKELQNELGIDPMEEFKNQLDLPQLEQLPSDYESESEPEVVPEKEELEPEAIPELKVIEEESQVEIETPTGSPSDDVIKHEFEPIVSDKDSEDSEESSDQEEAVEGTIGIDSSFGGEEHVSESSGLNISYLSPEEHEEQMKSLETHDNLEFKEPRRPSLINSSMIDLTEARFIPRGPELLNIDTSMMEFDEEEPERPSLDDINSSIVDSLMIDEEEPIRPVLQNLNTSVAFEDEDEPEKSFVEVLDDLVGVEDDKSESIPQEEISTEENDVVEERDDPTTSLGDVVDMLVDLAEETVEEPSEDPALEPALEAPVLDDVIEESDETSDIQEPIVAVEESVVEEPAVEEVIEEELTEEPLEEELIVKEPVEEEPVIDEPIVEELVDEEVPEISHSSEAKDEGSKELESKDDEKSFVEILDSLTEVQELEAEDEQGTQVNDEKTENFIDQQGSDEIIPSEQFKEEFQSESDLQQEIPEPEEDDTEKAEDPEPVFSFAYSIPQPSLESVGLGDTLPVVEFVEEPEVKYVEYGDEVELEMDEKDILHPTDEKEPSEPPVEQGSSESTVPQGEIPEYVDNGNDGDDEEEVIAPTSIIEPSEEPEIMEELMDDEESGLVVVPTEIFVPEDPIVAFPQYQVTDEIVDGEVISEYSRIEPNKRVHEHTDEVPSKRRKFNPLSWISSLIGGKPSKAESKVEDELEQEDEQKEDVKEDEPQEEELQVDDQVVEEEEKVVLRAEEVEGGEAEEVEEVEEEKSFVEILDGLVGEVKPEEPEEPEAEETEKSNDIEPKEPEPKESESKEPEPKEENIEENLPEQRPVRKSRRFQLDTSPEDLEPAHLLRDGHKFGLDVEDSKDIEEKPELQNTTNTSLGNSPKKKRSTKKRPTTKLASKTIPKKQSLAESKDVLASRTRSKSPIKETIQDIITDNTPIGQRLKRTRKRKQMYTDEEIQEEQETRGRKR